MLRALIFCLFSISSIVASAGELDPISKTNRGVFSSLTFVVADDITRARIGNRKSNDRLNKNIYPNYFISPKQRAPYSWETDGFTVLKNKPSDKSEVRKIDLIQDELRKYWGEEEFKKRMNSLSEVYSLLDIRYYSISRDDRSLDGCISVRWKALLNGTMHACGLHLVENDELYFEIREYGDDHPGTLQDQSMGLDDAIELMEVAVAALNILYKDFRNQELLIQALQEKTRTRYKD